MAFDFLLIHLLRYADMYRQSSLLPSSGVWYSTLPAFSALIMRCSSLIVGHHRWLEGSFLGRLGLEDVLAIVLEMRLFCVFSQSCIPIVAPPDIFKGSPLLLNPGILSALPAHPNLRSINVLGYVCGTGGLGPSPRAWRIDGTVKTARGPQDPIMME